MLTRKSFRWDGYDLSSTIPARKIGLMTHIKLFAVHSLIIVILIVACVACNRWFVKNLLQHKVFPYFDQANYWDVSTPSKGFFAGVACYEAYLTFSQKDIRAIIATGFEKFDVGLARKGVTSSDPPEIRAKYDRQVSVFGEYPFIGMDIPIGMMYPFPHLDMNPDDIYYAIPEDGDTQRFVVIINAARGQAWVSYCPGD